MDVRAATDALEATARKSDPDAAGRFVVVFVAPGDGGLFIFRPGCGMHQLGGDGAERRTFAESLREAIEKIWPESSKKTRKWLRVAADFLAHSPIGRALGSASHDNDDDDAPRADRTKALYADTIH